MPANLPPEWYSKKEEVDRASGKDKIKKLQELLSITPTHKGTENLRAQLKRKLAELKKEQKKRASVSRRSVSVPKEGCAQVSIIGLPNSGKSTFLKRITDAEPKIADYPYTTVEPEVGMFEYGGVQIQMVEIPSTFTRGVMSVAHSSDLILLFIGEVLDEDEQIEELNKIREKEKFDRWMFIKGDISREDLFEKLWSKLGLIRVYTKEPGKKKVEKPVVLKKGSVVEDVCKRLHKDFLKYFNFAKIKGPSAKFDWERVGLEHELKDGDIVEIHLKK